MQRYRVEITKVAESDINEIFRYIAADNASTADNFITELEKQIDSLEHYPLRCPIIQESQELGKEYRHIIYGRYRTFFRVDGSSVIIMRVIHGARLLSTNIFETK